MSQYAAEEFASLAMLPTSLAEMDAATACMGFAAGGFSSELIDAGDMDINYDPGLVLMGFSGDGFLCRHPDSPPAAYMEALTAAGFDLPVECPAPAPAAASEREESRKQASNKRRVGAVATSPDGASAGSPPTPFPGSNVDSTDEKPRKKDSTSRKVKKGRCSGKEEETPKEVVHVRARRGQATDSHSLAERVRREKINEKMRCLKDLVPGCYKAMGMAVMLDEIINYVQSLQNQVEFLSMKLSAASAVYDLNPELDSSVVLMAPQSLPRVGEADEAHHEVDRLMGKGQGLGGAPASTQQCPFDLTFGHYSSLLL